MLQAATVQANIYTFVYMQVEVGGSGVRCLGTVDIGQGCCLLLERRLILSFDSFCCISADHMMALTPPALSKSMTNTKQPKFRPLQIKITYSMHLRRETVTTAGQSYGGPSEKFLGGFWGQFSEVSP